MAQLASTTIPAVLDTPKMDDSTQQVTTSPSTPAPASEVAADDTSQKKVEEKALPAKTLPVKALPTRLTLVIKNMHHPKKVGLVTDPAKDASNSVTDAAISVKESTSIKIGKDATKDATKVTDTPVTNATMTKKEKLAAKRAAKEAAAKRPPDTVVTYPNPHDHFLQRKYRQFKAVSPPEFVETLHMFREFAHNAIISMKAPIAIGFLGPLDSAQTDSDGKVMDSKIESPPGVVEEKKETKETPQETPIPDLSENKMVVISVDDNDNQVSKVVVDAEPIQDIAKNATKIFADRLGDVVEKTGKILSALDKGQFKVSRKQFAKLFSELLDTKQPLSFSNPTDHAFLDDPNLQFFIFREGRVTVYVILDNDVSASLVQTHPIQFGKLILNSDLLPVVKKPSNPPPLTISELKHLQSCYVRYQRGKKHLQAGRPIEQTKLKALPLGFVRDVKNVRRLVAQSTGRSKGSTKGSVKDGSAKGSEYDDLPELEDASREPRGSRVSHMQQMAAHTRVQKGYIPSIDEVY